MPYQAVQSPLCLCQDSDDLKTAYSHDSSRMMILPLYLTKATVFRADTTVHRTFQPFADQPVQPAFENGSILVRDQCFSAHRYLTDASVLPGPIALQIEITCYRASINNVLPDKFFLPISQKKRVADTGGDYQP